MGLFEKKFCDLCNEKVNMLTRLKLSDGYLCSDCKKKLSCLSGNWGARSITDVKTHLEARENNKQKYAQFRMTSSAGADDKIMVDMQNGKFCFNIGRDYSENNPEIFDFSQLMDFYIKESYSDERDSDGDGIPDRVDTFDNRTQTAAQPKGGAMNGMGMNGMGMNGMGMNGMGMNGMGMNGMGMNGMGMNGMGMNGMGMNGMGMNSMGMNNQISAVSRYIRNTDRTTDSDGNPRRVSSIDAYITVNHPYISVVKLDVKYISENALANEIMQAYNDALAIMQLCEQIKNPNGGFSNQNNAQYAQQNFNNQNNAQYAQQNFNNQNTQQYNQQNFNNQNTQQYNQQSVPQSAAVMPFCPSCGAQNTDMSAFCSNCGGSLKK